MLSVAIYRNLSSAIESVIIIALFLVLAAVALYLRARLGFVL